MCLLAFKFYLGPQDLCFFEEGFKQTTISCNLLDA
jgi:hypothetical protein